MYLVCRAPFILS